MNRHWMIFVLAAMSLPSCVGSPAEENSAEHTAVQANDRLPALRAMSIDTPRQYALSMFNLPYQLTITPDASTNEKAATLVLTQQNDTVFHQYITLDSIIAHYPDTLFQKDFGDPEAFRQNMGLAGLEYGSARSDRLYLQATFFNPTTEDTSGAPLTFRYRRVRPGEWWAGMF